MIPLGDVAAEPCKTFPNSLVFDAFGDHRQTQIPTEINDRANDGFAACVGEETGDKGLVDFDFVHWQLLQV